MTAALLKQAREALEQIDAYPIPMTGDPEDAKFAMRNIQSVAARTLKALTAFDSLSEYDKAVHALAPYLPDGWVAQDGDGCTGFTDRQNSPYMMEDGGAGFVWWAMPLGWKDLSRIFEIPKHQDARTSLRRITHNSDGTVTVTKG